MMRFNYILLQTFLRESWRILFGTILFLAVIILAVLAAFFYIYRLLVIHVLAPFFRKDIAQPLTLVGETVSCELFFREAKIATRISIVTCVIRPGTVPFERTLSTLKDKWVDVRDSKTGVLLYPEFRQSIHNYLGILFWKNDPNFDLQNHLKLHTINEKASAEESEKFLTDLIESLLNKPFPPDRSPWEFHIVHNYRNEDILRNAEVEEDRQSVLILRMHHGMADGYTIMNMLACKLADSSVADWGSKITSAKVMPKVKSRTIFNDALKGVQFFGKLIRDLGFIGNAAFFEPKTPLHIPDRRKKWKQVYARSRMISLEKIKRVKNKFGVSLTSVILSSISYGISRQFEKEKWDSKRTRSLPFLTPLPLPNHPDGLVNHTTGTILKIPLGLGIGPRERLLEAERKYQRGKESVIPIITPVVQRLVACFPIQIIRFFLRNRWLCTGLTNFPGPGREITWDGIPVLSCHFSVGPFQGVAGMAFMVLSYKDHLWICANAEEGALSRAELNRVIGWICSEIDRLDGMEAPSNKLA